MNLEDKIKFWEKKARECYKVAKQQYELRNFLWCLFFCHLTIEKVIKARVLEITKKEAPHIHDLLILSNLAKIELSKELFDTLKIITEFNIEARYDDYREKLRKQANKNFTERYLNITKELLKWFLGQG